MNRLKSNKDLFDENGQPEVGKSTSRRKSSRPKKTSHKEKGVAYVGKMFFSVFEGSFLTHKKFIKNIPFLFLLLAISITYIYLNYSSERTMIKLEQSKRDLIELRYEFISSKADMMDSLRESTIMQKLSTIGIHDNNKPPYKLVFNPDTLSNE